MFYVTCHTCQSQIGEERSLEKEGDDHVGPEHDDGGDDDDNDDDDDDNDNDNDDGDDGDDYAIYKNNGMWNIDDLIEKKKKYPVILFAENISFRYWVILDH